MDEANGLVTSSQIYIGALIGHFILEWVILTILMYRRQYITFVDLMAEYGKFLKLYFLLN